MNQAYPTLVTQENHYDPWGVAIEREVVADTSKLPRFEMRDRFTYNGKELQGTLNYLDYGARMYDATIGRWGVVDPLSEKMANTSSYSYTFNNPVKYVDKNGEIPIIPWLLKAGAGAAADMLAQASMDYLFNSSTTSWSQAFDNVNWYQVGRSGVEGLIPWKTPGGKLGRAAGTAAGDVLVNAINNPSGYTAEQAGIDFATGFVGDLAGGGMGELLSKYGAKQVASGLVSKLGWASKAAHSITGVWHSGTDGNFAGAVANKLGDVVEDVDVNFEFSGGKGDIDIVTKTFNIEVKSGKSPNLSQSLKNLEYSKNQGKGYILYMPKANRAQIYDAAKRGVTLLRTEAELKQATGGN